MCFRHSLKRKKRDESEVYNYKAKHKKTTHSFQVGGFIEFLFVLTLSALQQNGN